MSASLFEKVVGAGRVCPSGALHLNRVSLSRAKTPEEMSAVYAMIRRYRMTGSMDRLMEKVASQFAAQLSTEDPEGPAAPVRIPAGILSYQAVRTGDDTLLTVTVFASAELLARAQQGAADIRQSLKEFHVEEIETFSGEVSISRVSEALLA
ncbi:hypothetical protein [Mycolicibacterium sp.]|uniref:hypothetical protein n=1 Tax=Mycolicibacterium sp. TaxID=2320850 RepID=UPI0037CA6AFE